VKSLDGRMVVVTRAAAQAAGIESRLRRLGATVVSLPTIEIDDPADGGAALASAASDLARGAYDWVVLTSTNGARRLLARVDDPLAVGGARVAAIGPATARVLGESGLTVDLVPDRYVAEALVEAFPSGRGRVLVARAAVARDVLPQGLRAKGWNVDVVEAYRTRPARPSSDDVERAATAEVIAFTSPSTVDGAIGLLGLDRVPPVVACIGPVTAAAARERGLKVAIEAEVHTVDGLVDAVVAWEAGRDARR
jgi:uroporphyrinogen-III synthase